MSKKAAPGGESVTLNGLFLYGRDEVGQAGVEVGNLQNTPVKISLTHTKLSDKLPKSIYRLGDAFDE